MNGVIVLAADLIERAANPAYGEAVNEIAAWRFERVFIEDQALRRRIVEDTFYRDSEDLNVLSFSGWIWLLSWRQRNGGRLPEVVLRYLFDIAGSADARFQLRHLVCRDPYLNERRELQGSTSQDYPSWLAEHVSDAAQGLIDPYELQRQLLQIATDVAVDALRRLLATEGVHRWPLVAELRQFLDGLDLASSVREAWARSLGIESAEQ